MPPWKSWCLCQGSLGAPKLLTLRVQACMFPGILTVQRLQVELASSHNILNWAGFAACTGFLAILQTFSSTSPHSTWNIPSPSTNMHHSLTSFRSHLGFKVEPSLAILPKMAAFIPPWYFLSLCQAYSWHLSQFNRIPIYLLLAWLPPFLCNPHKGKSFFHFIHWPCTVLRMWQMLSTSWGWRQYAVPLTGVCVFGEHSLS